MGIRISKSLGSRLLDLDVRQATHACASKPQTSHTQDHGLPPAFRKDDTPLNRKPGGLMEQSNASLQRGDQG